MEAGSAHWALFWGGGWGIRPGPARVLRLCRKGHRDLPPSLPWSQRARLPAHWGTAFILVSQKPRGQGFVVEQRKGVLGTLAAFNESTLDTVIFQLPT